MAQDKSTLLSNDLSTVVQDLLNQKKVETDRPILDQVTKKVGGVKPASKILLEDEVDGASFINEPNAEGLFNKTKFKDAEGVEDIVFDFSKGEEFKEKVVRDSQQLKRDVGLSDFAKQALISIVPGIVGAAFGGAEGGATGFEAGLEGQKFLIEERRREEDRLAKAAGRGPGAGASRRFQQVRYEDSEGKVRLGTFDRQTGDFQLDQNDPSAGFNPVVRLDEEGNLVSISKGQLEPKQISKRQKPFTPKEEKDIGKIKSEMLKDDEFKKSVARIREAETALGLLESENPIADRAVRILLARASGEVGNLAQAEQEQFGSSPQLAVRARQLSETLFGTGQLTAENRRDLKEIAVIFDKLARARANSTIEKFARSQGILSGVETSRIIDVLKPFTPDPLRSKQSAEEARKELPKGPAEMSNKDIDNMSEKELDAFIKSQEGN